MRYLFVATAALAMATAATSQEVAPGQAVERVMLHPGDVASFTLAPGKDHQLLNAAPSSGKGAITIRYNVANGQSTVTATSRTGYPTTFTVLADPDGNGGFEPAGEIQLPGDGIAISHGWPREMGTINVGDFAGGQHGTESHPPSGE